MCDNCKNTNSQDNNAKAAEVGQAVGSAIAGGLGFLGKGTIWLSRQVAVGTAGAGKAIASEWKRQGNEGFSKK